MARVTGPLQSFDASGKLAGSVVFSKWKGRNYVRRLVTPANPKSAGQVSMRAMMRFLATIWATRSSNDQALWEARAATGNYSPFNAFTSFNQLRWANYQTPVVDPDASGGGAAVDTPTLAASAGVRDVTVTNGLTTLNDGWGVIIYRSLTPGFTPSLTNAVYIQKYDGTNDVTFVDGPLTPETYNYNATPFSTEGDLESAIGEVSAVVA